MFIKHKHKLGINPPISHTQNSYRLDCASHVHIPNIKKMPDVISPMVLVKMWALINHTHGFLASIHHFQTHLPVTMPSFSRPFAPWHRSPWPSRLPRSNQSGCCRNSGCARLMARPGWGQSSKIVSQPSRQVAINHQNGDII